MLASVNGIRAYWILMDLDYRGDWRWLSMLLDAFVTLFSNVLDFTLN